MASIKMLPVPPNLNLEELTNAMAQIYQDLNYSVSVVSSGNGFSIDLRKDDAGLKKYLGLSTGLRVHMTLSSGTLTVSYHDEDWVIKIAIFAAAVLLVSSFIGVPLAITSGYGILCQLDLSNKTYKHIKMLAASFKEQL